MSQTNKLVFYLNLIIILVIATVVIVYAWTNPFANPPGGAGTITVDANNYVGIGGAPISGYRLTVNGAAILGSSTGGGLAIVSLDLNSVNLRPSIPNGDILISDDSGISSRGLLIANGGNVGIGVPIPGEKLHVGGNGIQFSDGSLTFRLGEWVDNINTRTWTYLTRGSGTGYGSLAVGDLYVSGDQSELSGAAYFGGNVGIGTTAARKLEVVDGDAIKIGQAYISSGAGWTHFASNAFFNGTAWVIPDNTRRSALLQFHPTDSSIRFYQTQTAGGTDWTGRMTIDSGGDVGIGANPVSGVRLKSVTSEGNAGWFTNNSPATYAALIVLNTGGGWGIYDSLSGKHYLNGNLGIGMTPVYKLDVTGDINVGATNVYRRGGIPGISASCPAGYVLKGATVSGGIITGGVCAVDDAGAGGGGDITDVIAGSGLTGGGTSGAVTLNVGAGTGISVAADLVSLNTAAALNWIGVQTFSGGASMNGTKISNLAIPTLGTDAANKSYVDSISGGTNRAWMTVESQICNFPVKIPTSCPAGWTSYGPGGSYVPPDCSGGPAIGYRVCYKAF